MTDKTRAEQFAEAQALTLKNHGPTFARLAGLERLEALPALVRALVASLSRCKVGAEAHSPVEQCKGPALWRFLTYGEPSTCDAHHWFVADEVEVPYAPALRALIAGVEGL